MVSSWGNLGNMMAEKLSEDQLNAGYQFDQIPATPNIQPVPRPTGANPSTVSYLGNYGFIVKFHRLSDNIKNKSWDVSLFKINRWLEQDHCTYIICFTAHNAILTCKVELINFLHSFQKSCGSSSLI